LDTITPPILHENIRVHAKFSSSNSISKSNYNLYAMWSSGRKINVHLFNYFFFFLKKIYRKIVENLTYDDIMYTVRYNNFFKFRILYNYLFEFF